MNIIDLKNKEEGIQSPDNINISTKNTNELERRSSSRQADGVVLIPARPGRADGFTDGENEIKSSEDTILEWVSEEKKEIEKNWKIGIIAFLVLVSILFTWQKNYFGIILILIIGFLIFFFLKKENTTYFAILERGIRIDKELFSWTKLEHFWIFEDSAEIYIATKKSYLPFIIIPLPEEYFETTRQILSNFLPEKEVEKSLIDIISKKIGL